MPYSAAAKNRMLEALGVTTLSLHSTDPGSTGAGELTGGTPAYRRLPVVASVGASVGSKVVSGARKFDVAAGVSVGFVGQWDGAAVLRGSAAAVNIAAAGNLVLVIDALAAVTVALAAADTPATVVTKINTAIGATAAASLTGDGVLLIVSATQGTASKVTVDATTTAGILTDLKLTSGQVATGKVAEWLGYDDVPVESYNAQGTYEVPSTTDDLNALPSA